MSTMPRREAASSSGASGASPSSRQIPGAHQIRNTRQMRVDQAGDEQGLIGGAVEQVAEPVGDVKALDLRLVGPLNVGDDPGAELVGQFREFHCRLTYINPGREAAQWNAKLPPCRRLRLVAALSPSQPRLFRAGRRDASPKRPGPGPTAARAHCSRCASEVEWVREEASNCGLFTKISGAMAALALGLALIGAQQARAEGAEEHPLQLNGTDVAPTALRRRTR